jgi:hypothetical protein
MEATDLDPKGSVVSFPAKIQLEWVVEKFSLDINMGLPTINPTFPKEQRLALFTEPQISGAVRTDLAKLNQGPASSSASSRIYESPPRSGVRLGNPETEPFAVEGATLAPPSNPNPLAANTSNLPALPEAYVGPQVPMAPDQGAIQTSGSPAWSRGTFR